MKQGPHLSPCARIRGPMDTFGGKWLWVLLLLASCGGGSGTPRGPIYDVDLIVGAPPFPGALGYTERLGDRYLVTLSPDVEGADEKMAVIRHELGHCRGLEHGSDPSCVMYPTIFVEASVCPLEAAGAASFGDGVTYVRVTDNALLGPATAAAVAWNEAAGRDLFMVYEPVIVGK